MRSNLLTTRAIARTVLVGLLVVAASLTASACVPLKGAPPPQDPLAELLTLVNTARAANGAGPLVGCGPLAFAADAHNRDMAATGNFDHTGSDGSDPAVRAIRFGYNSAAVGENIAMGQSSALEVFIGWMNSPGHRQNILDPSYTHGGFATFAGYWTQVFGSGGVC
jgi:uncharacterized protein YkwD